MIETLLIGPLNSLTQNVIYAMPARKVKVSSNVQLQVSMTTTTTDFTNTSAVTEFECSAPFVRSTTGAAKVYVKV